ncbi:hypothetical protein RI129_005736 [Pyrocoelia pectoralis]|uniref:Uncharacterized protein n=1 Tax=Pyrocoelia pectoralis TaxID=417401 RepID=A0AAN7ZNP8_9COLE
MVSEFVSAFHSLSGITIAERKKNLYQLLKDNVNSTINFAEICPSTQLEETFKADVAIFFKNTDEMFKLLKNENLAVIEKLLKEDWFIKNICENITGEELVSDIFPNISYNTKLKLLNRLTLNIDDPIKGDEFFYWIKECYGLYLACKLLPSCSPGLILQTLKMGRVELTPKQLLLTIEKNPSITSNLIEKLFDDPSINLGEKYEYVFRHLIRTDPEILIKFDERCNQRFRLGKRATRHFLINHEQYFLKHSRKLYKLLDVNEIGRCLREDFRTVFFDIFPKSVSDLRDNFDEYLSLLNVLPTNEEKLDILFSTFKLHYGGEVLAHSEFIVPKIFEWMSPDFKQNWLRTHEKPTEVSEEQWISFMNSEQSVTLLKKKLSSTSIIKEREKLIVALVQTCKVNNDLVALADVCEYVMSRHRNDHVKVKTAFLNTLHDSFKLKKLKEEHWKHLKQFIQVCCAGNLSNFITEKFIIALTYFNLKNGLPITEPLKLYVKICYGRYNILCFNPEYEKRCLNEFYEIIPLCFQNDDLKYSYMEFLRSICHWNKRHPNERISIFSYTSAINKLTTMLEEKDYYSTAHEVAIECLIGEYEKASEMNLLNLLFSKSKVLHGAARIIKHYPLSMVEHLESLLQKIFKSYMSLDTLRHLFRNIADSNIQQQIATICKKEMDNNLECNHEKRYAIYILSFVSTHEEEFLKSVRDLYPVDSVANLDNPKYNLQQAVPTSFRYFNNPFSALEPILHFCQGDYMQFAQKSLYHIVHNTAEHRLEDFLNKLGKRAVSIRKHSIFLSFKLLNKTTTNNLLSKVMESEKNASIRKTLFQSVLNYFLRNPDPYMWQLVQDSMKTVDVDDTETFKILIVRLKKVPKEFFSVYVLFTWQSLDRLTDKETIEENKRKVLAAITKTNITMLPVDFCTNLIRQHLFTSNDTSFQEKMYSFTSTYIMHSTHSNLPEIFSEIRNRSPLFPKIAYNLIKQLCTDFIDDKFANENNFVKFVTLWNEGVEPCYVLPDHIHLHLCLMLCNSRKHKSAVTIGTEISKFFLDLHEKRCADVNELKKCFEVVFKDLSLSHLSGSNEESRMVIIESIIDYSDGPVCLSLGVSLLPDEIMPLPKVRKIYDGIIERARTCSDPTVQIMLRNHLINKE